MRVEVAPKGHSARKKFGRAYVQRGVSYHRTLATSLEATVVLILRTISQKY